MTGMTGAHATRHFWCAIRMARSNSRMIFQATAGMPGLIWGIRKMGYIHSGWVPTVEGLAQRTSFSSLASCRFGTVYDGTVKRPLRSSTRCGYPALLWLGVILRNIGLICGIVMVLVSCGGSAVPPPSERQAKGDAPRLLPSSALFDHASLQNDGDIIRSSATPLARATRLRARAAQLRGPVIAPTDHARLRASGQNLR